MFDDAQAVYMVTMMTLVGVLPISPSLRRKVYEWAALTVFRIYCRSVSAVITFHNVQHRPKSDGICVANHTTPIDAVILQHDRAYALVRPQAEEEEEAEEEGGGGKVGPRKELLSLHVTNPAVGGAVVVRYGVISQRGLSHRSCRAV